MSIKFKDLTYVYSPKTPYEYKALENINVEIPQKKIVAIIGETGSGKSTLIQHINGLIIPTKGEVNINDFVIKATNKKIRNIKKIRKEIGLVFQFPEYQLFEETIEKDIMFGPINFGESKKNAQVLAKKYLQIVGLEENYLQRSPFDLSGGQKRRVAIAGILALEGHTLILDEPTAGLDPDGEKEFLNLFEKLNKQENKTIIIVTHNMNHVLQIADEVIVLQDTKFIRKQDPVSLFKDKKFIAEFKIEAPQIYNFLHNLDAAGIDISDIDARNIDQLIVQLAKKIKGKS